MAKTTLTVPIEAAQGPRGLLVAMCDVTRGSIGLPISAQPGSESYDSDNTFGLSDVEGGPGG